MKLHKLFTLFVFTVLSILSTLASANEELGVTASQLKNISIENNVSFGKNSPHNVGHGILSIKRFILVGGHSFLSIAFLNSGNERGCREFGPIEYYVSIPISLSYHIHSGIQSALFISELHNLDINDNQDLYRKVKIDVALSSLSFITTLVSLTSLSFESRSNNDCRLITTAIITSANSVLMTASSIYSVKLHKRIEDAYGSKYSAAKKKQTLFVSPIINFSNDVNKTAIGASISWKFSS